jgi:hypothetical protein
VDHKRTQGRTGKGKESQGVMKQTKWYPTYKTKPSRNACPVCNGTMTVIDAKTKLERKCVLCKKGWYEIK